MELVGSDPFPQMNRTYARDVHRTLVAAEGAASVNAAIIIDQPIYTEILEHAAAHLDPSRQAAASNQ